MSSYSVQHLLDQSTFHRPRVLLNPHANKDAYELYAEIDPAIEAFHSTFPDYAETPLHDLTSVARELGFARVFLKDESIRFGLPSFKIVGGSWAVHRVLCRRLSLPASSTSFADLKSTLAARKDDVRLVTCTDGNWGRAMARMAKYLDVKVTIYVPGFMHLYTQTLLRDEGADVRVVADGSYDEAIKAVRQEESTTGALMIMDTSWDGYEEIPGWVTEGYSTLHRETDRQVAALTAGRSADLVFASVGVGSWAHSVVAHYANSLDVRAVAVEPAMAASFKESLHCNALTPIETADTIMCGMNCGTTSKIAWPVLKHGVWASVTVTDLEAHRSVLALQAEGINAGPCGAATLAALRQVCTELEVSKRADKVVVLFSTEGMREYEVPT